MNGAVKETPLVFACGDDELVGLVSEPAAAAAQCGVLVLVGGPQYRVGSHRQFALMAHRLALAGHAAMRFDFRGMGDSSGPLRDFEQVHEDVAAALAAFRRQCPGLRRIVLWGLCDAASAALLYCRERRDPEVAGLCLLNPWVRSAETLAKTQVKHYYVQRLLQREFWLKLLRGRLNVASAVAELLAKLRLARGGGTVAAGPAAPFQSRMAEGLRGFDGPVLLLISGDDYTAKEFLERAASDPAWKGLLSKSGLSRRDFPEADHTFSSAVRRAQAEDALIAWLAEWTAEAGGR